MDVPLKGLCLWISEVVTLFVFHSLCLFCYGQAVVVVGVLRGEHDAFL
jgi:hypothetical protein